MLREFSHGAVCEAGGAAVTRDEVLRLAADVGIDSVSGDVGCLELFASEVEKAVLIKVGMEMSANMEKFINEIRASSNQAV